jgi:hypothetical protein
MIVSAWQCADARHDLPATTVPCADGRPKKDLTDFSAFRWMKLALNHFRRPASYKIVQFGNCHVRSASSVRCCFICVFET